MTDHNSRFNEKLIAESVDLCLLKEYIGSLKEELESVRGNLAAQRKNSIGQVSFNELVVGILLEREAALMLKISCAQKTYSTVRESRFNAIESALLFYMHKEGPIDNPTFGSVQEEIRNKLEAYVNS